MEYSEAQCECISAFCFSISLNVIILYHSQIDALYQPATYYISLHSCWITSFYDVDYVYATSSFSISITIETVV